MTPAEHSQIGDGGPVGGMGPAPGVCVPRAALRFSYSRSGGPGGQNVNKVNTRAELRIAIAAIEGLSPAAGDRLRRLAGSRLTREDELVIVCDSSRSQGMNRAEAMERLSDLIAKAAKEPRVRKKRRISRAAKERRLERKRKQGERKQRRQWRGE